MKILHVILDDKVKKNLVYVMNLTNDIAQQTENHLTTDKHVNIPNAEIIPLEYSRWNILKIRNAFLKILYTLMPDIVHVHGCWNYANYLTLKMAKDRGFVTFFSTYGEITMKDIKTHFWKKRLWQLIWYQRHMIKIATQVILQNKKEENVIGMLGRNDNFNIIPHTAENGGNSKQILELYQQAHSDAVRSDISMQTLAAIHDQLNDLLNLRPMREVRLSHREQEQYSIFCETHNLTDTVKESYSIPRYNDGDACGVIYKMIIQLKKDIQKEKATFNDIFQLAATIQKNDYDEDQLMSGLEKSGNVLFTRRILNIADELCSIDVGFMPCLPLKDEETTNLKLRLFKVRQ